jgi:hypothetical protein
MKTLALAMLLIICCHQSLAVEVEAAPLVLAETSTFPYVGNRHYIIRNTQWNIFLGILSGFDGIRGDNYDIRGSHHSQIWRLYSSGGFYYIHVGADYLGMSGTESYLASTNDLNARLTIEDVPGEAGSYCIKSQDGRYLRMQQNTNEAGIYVYEVNTQTSCGAWEKWNFIAQNPYPTV